MNYDIVHIHINCAYVNVISISANIVLYSIYMYILHILFRGFVTTNIYLYIIDYNSQPSSIWHKVSDQINAL